MSEARMLRERQEGIDLALDRLQRPNRGGRRILCQCRTAPTGADKFFSAYELTPSGVESEGNRPSFTVGTQILYVLATGPTLPGEGSYFVARAINGRWVVDGPSSGPPLITITPGTPPCCNGGIPGTLFLSIASTFPWPAQTLTFATNFPAPPRPVLNLYGQPIRVGWFGTWFTQPNYVPPGPDSLNPPLLCYVMTCLLPSGVTPPYPVLWLLTIDQNLLLPAIGGEPLGIGELQAGAYAVGTPAGVGLNPDYCSPFSVTFNASMGEGYLYGAGVPGIVTIHG